MYALTVSLDEIHNDRIKAFSKKYATQSYSSRLGTNLVLFHALPGSQLRPKIMPAIEELCSNTRNSAIDWLEPWTHSQHRISIPIADQSGGVEIRHLHQQLLEAWLLESSSGDQWLRRVDRGAPLLECRISPKARAMVGEQAAKTLAAAKEEISQGETTADGLMLWRVTPRWWQLQKKFPFSDAESNRTSTEEGTSSLRE